MSGSSPRIINAATEIDTVWVQSVLRQEGDPDVKVVSIDKQPIGAGNVSDTIRVGIEYADAHHARPAGVIVKLRAGAPDAHSHALRSGAYHREIGAYREIGRRRACRIPHCYWVDGDETNINLVMEDLTGITTPGNQVAGCGADEAEAVVVELARLHSSFYPLTDETAPGWLIRMAEVCNYWSEAAVKGAQEAVSRFRMTLPPDFIAIIEAATPLVRTWYLLPQRHLTLTHGDPRVDNVLFDTSGPVVSACLIDWQVTGLRNPMYDIGYFLSGSVGVSERRLHERRLLKRYIDVFSSRATGYDESEAIVDYRIQLLSGLYITLAAVAVLPNDDVVNRLILALLQRNCAAAVDWNSIEAVKNMSVSQTATSSD